MSAMYRIIDANVNRLREALRVIEDIIRYQRDDASVFAVLKRLRHVIESITRGIDDELLRARKSDADVGKRTLTDGEKERRDSTHILRANFIRAEESARVLEETLKTIDADKSETAKEIRFTLYTLEKRILAGTMGKKKIGINAAFFDAPYTGFGRYTRTLVSALLALDTKNDYVLFAPNGISLPRSLHRRNVRVVPLGKQLCEQGHRHWDLHFTDEADFINEHVDVLFVPYNTPPQPQAKGYKLVITVHDVIPLLGLDPYAVIRHPSLLAGLSLSTYSLFSKDMRYVRTHADRIITISSHSRSDIARVLRVPEKNIDIVANAVDFHADPARGAKRKGYILYVGGIGKRKNLMGVLRAYRMLSPEMRAQNSLVVVAPTAGTRYQRFIDTNGLAASITVHDRVDEKKLAELYRNAALFVFPSLYEGFGLPPAEAMACGIPVVTSESTSLPEVTGGFAHYCDPYRPKSIHDAVVRALNESELLRKKRIADGQEYIRSHFNAKALAQKLRDVLVSV
ncbi:MAG: glycosyltransferase [Spirochaetota bacterium]